jgi:hypothetical protein
LAGACWIRLLFSAAPIAFKRAPPCCFVFFAFSFSPPPCHPRGLASARGPGQYTDDAKPRHHRDTERERSLITASQGSGAQVSVGVSRSGKQWFGFRADRQQTHQAGVEAARVAAR